MPLDLTEELTYQIYGLENVLEKADKEIAALRHCLEDANKVIRSLRCRLQHQQDYGNGAVDMS